MAGVSSLLNVNCCAYFQKFLVEVRYNYAGNQPTISGGVSKSTYQFDKLFLHWSNDSNATEGSYHTLDGMYYDMEIQAYYDKIPKSYLPDFLSGFFHKDGEDTAIISQLFEVIYNNTVSCDYSQ